MVNTEKFWLIFETVVLFHLSLTSIWQIYWIFSKTTFCTRENWFIVIMIFFLKKENVIMRKYFFNKMKTIKIGFWSKVTFQGPYNINE